MKQMKLAAAVLLAGGLAVVLALRGSAPDPATDPVEAAAGHGDEPRTTDFARADAAIHVYKTETCGCCGLWVEHLRAGGFEVTVEDLSNAALAAVKQRHGIPAELGSCHTALAGGYVLEGHIPSDVIQSFLEEAPGVKGIAVPGMPVGSPGMEVEGVQPRPYDVIAFDGNGNRTVYRRVDPR